MINHIVMWKFRDDVLESDKLEMKRRLDSLKGQLPTLVNISVGIDVSRSDRSWDMVLYSEFESMEGLKSYAIHPEHLKVGEFIKTLVSESAAVDYEA